MAYEEREYNKTEYQNDWALDIKEKAVHITNAKSGAQGYYCMGCREEMQGVKFKNPKYQSYFRHHVSNIDTNKIECIVASRNYRERIASAILNRLKYVKVPTLYKYPPKGIEKLPMLLEQSKVINASYVKSELTFYEDEEGNIKWGKNLNIQDRYLLIRPDVTFFDSKDNPILFIEFVVHHKLDIEKISKLNRIGVNTIQIIIPKVPEELIEEAIKSVRKYKWVYNELEANTKYVSVSKGNTEEVPPIDEQQRNLFEESFICRTSKINELLRAFEKCLQSESYKRNERLFNSEISRVTQNTESANQKLGDLEESNRRDALARNQNEEDYEDSEYTDLDKRYFAEKRRLEDAVYNASVDQKFRAELIENIRAEEEEIERIEQEEIDFEAEIREREQNQFSDPITRERKEIDNLEKTIRTSINRELASTNSTIKLLGVSNNDIPARTERDFSFPRELEEGEIIRITGEIEQLDEEERILEDKISNDFKGEIQFEESEITRIRKEEGNIEESAGREFDREIKNNARGLSKEFTDLLEAQRMGGNFKEFKTIEERYKRSQKFFDKGTWEKE
jgi:hypothetical protein